jgi:hypothetical protein
MQHTTKNDKELFGPAPANLFLLSHELWGPLEKLDEGENGDLCRPFYSKNALFAVEVNKAPSPDNIVLSTLLGSG